MQCHQGRASGATVDAAIKKANLTDPDTVSKDLGFTVQMQAVENADLINRFLSQSNTIDCADVSLVYMRYLIGRKEWDSVMAVNLTARSSRARPRCPP